MPTKNVPEGHINVQADPAPQTLPLLDLAGPVAEVWAPQAFAVTVTFPVTVTVPAPLVQNKGFLIRVVMKTSYFGAITPGALTELTSIYTALPVQEERTE